MMILDRKRGESYVVDGGILRIAPPWSEAFGAKEITAKAVGEVTECRITLHIAYGRAKL